MAETDNISNEDIFNLLKGVAAQNTEIKSDIRQIKEDNCRLAQHLENINNKVETLEQENKELKRELLATQRKIKRNNLIIFGVTEEEQEDIKSVVIQLFNEKLSVSLPDCEINNIYRIGQKKEKPRGILLEFVRNLKKQEVFKNVAKLKGTGISIANDLTETERQEKKILQKHLKTAREKHYNAKIIKNKLVINGETYTFEQLQSSETQVKTTYRSNSLPGTPTHDTPLLIEENTLQTRKNTDPAISPKSGTSKQKPPEKNLLKEFRKTDGKDIKTLASVAIPGGGTPVLTRSKRNLPDKSVSSPPAKKIK